MNKLREINQNMEATNSCKVALDLREFLKFDITNSKANQGSYISINKTKVTLSSSIGAKLENGQRMEVFINKKCNIIVIRESGNGMSLKPNGSGSTGKALNCMSLIKHVQEMKLDLPMRFHAQWDDDLQAWVGRR